MDPKKSGTVFAVLDLPIGASWSIDGKSIITKRDDFLGFESIPSDGKFHLVTLKITETGITQGFVLMRENSNRNNSTSSANANSDSDSNTNTNTNTNSDSDSNDNSNNQQRPILEPLVLYRYNPQTEEIPAKQIMDDLTRNNFLKHAESNILGQQRMIPYQRMHTEEERAKWSQSTSFIAPTLLERRGIPPNMAKIIPAVYSSEDSDHWKDPNLTTNNSTAKVDVDVDVDVDIDINDGSPIRYPPVACIDASSSFSLHKKKHLGTKLYLAKLSPAERTRILLGNDPGGQVLDRLLRDEYDQEWKSVLGDIQFSFLSFLHLHCFSSLQHWRDMIAMLSMVSIVAIETKYEELYTHLISVLSSQLQFMEPEFFEETDESGNNFFEPAMGRLIPPLVRTPNTISNSELNEAANSFWQLCLNKFPSFRFLRNENDHNEDNNHQVRRQQREEHTPIEDDDDDAVVVVSMEEYEASMARSSACGNSSTEMKTKMPAEHQSRFPILFAAVLPHEDIVMTCARALDERVDVSLVREAAQYLEEVVDSGRDELVG